MAKAMPVTLAAFTLAALSMIGVPPTAGFFSKWYLAVGSIEAGLWPLAALIVVSSLLSAVYFVRIFEQAYMRPAEPTPLRTEAPATALIPIVVTGVGVVLLGLTNAVVVTRVLEPIGAGLGR